MYEIHSYVRMHLYEVAPNFVESFPAKVSKWNTFSVPTVHLLLRTGYLRALCTYIMALRLMKYTALYCNIRTYVHLLKGGLCSG